MILKTFKEKDFHIYSFQIDLVEDNIQQRQLIKTFFFSFLEEIEISQKFVDNLVIQTNRIFNTNELNMPLLIIV